MRESSIPGHDDDVDDGARASDIARRDNVAASSSARTRGGRAPQSSSSALRSACRRFAATTTFWATISASCTTCTTCRRRLLSYFVSDWTEGIYGFTLDELRPLLAFTYWLDARLFGPTSVSGYHATNLVLHLLNALLVLAIARSIAPGEPAFAVLAASLFALMPSHAEPIAWISGRVDSLASLFYLGAFLCFVRFRLGNRPAWLLAALLIFTCGLFAKQSIVTFPRSFLHSICSSPSPWCAAAGRSRDCGRTCCSLCSRRCTGASPCAVRERRSRRHPDRCGDRRVLLPSEPLRPRTASHTQQRAPRDDSRRGSSDHRRAGSLRALGARRRPGLSARGAACALLRCSVVRHHHRPPGRDVPFGTASLHHDRRREHRGGITGLAGIPSGRATPDADSHGDSRNADRPLRSGLDLERVQVGDERHRVTEICLGSPSTAADSPSR